MDGCQKSGHAIHDIKYHVIWVTKYRYKVLRNQVTVRLRELIGQGCDARGTIILQGSVGKEHIHLLISCPPSPASSKVMQYLKGRSSRLLQDEFPEMKNGTGVSIYGTKVIFVQRLAP